MKISLNWLKEYVDINIPDDELIKLIGARLVEVEGVIDETHKYDNIYIVRVEKAEKIPDTHLTLCQINVGDVTLTGDAHRGTPKMFAEGKILGDNARQDPSGDTLVQVVCGAPNVREGMLAVWLAPGAIVPASVHEDAPFVIGKRKMLGKYESSGMLAGADELDLDDKHEKIVEINPEIAKPGDLLADVFELKDLILEIENKSLTHRPDCFGIIGFAREVAGILGQKFDEPEFLWQENVFDNDFIELSGNGVRYKNTKIKIDVTDKNLCPRYTCAAIKVKEATEQEKYLTKMQTRLAKSGMHTISKIVDATNYLMLLTGQPLHAFDYDKFIAVGKTETPNIIIRAAQKGETITLLDDKKISCNENDILITSNNIPVALAGAMGGKSTAIDDGTKNVLIESATFSLYNLRKTQMAHGIFSEAITRFTKGVPATSTYNVLAEAVYEIGAEPFDLNDIWPGYQAPTVVKITTGEINTLLGTNYAPDLIIKTLENVGFSVNLTSGVSGVLTNSTGDAHRGTPSGAKATVGDNARQDPSKATSTQLQLAVTAPIWRTDIHIKEDIIEEIGRLLGYDNIVPTLPLHGTAAKNPIFDLKKQIRSTMLRFGANELLTYSFISEKLLEKVNQAKDNSYKIINSISPELQYVRQSIIPSLLDKAYLNQKLPVDKFAIYEMNQVYQKAFGLNSENVPNFENHLGFIVAERKNQNTPFYQAKKYADELLEQFNIAVEYSQLKEKSALSSAFEPKRSAEIRLKEFPEIVIGIVGEFKNSIKHAFKLSDYLAGFEIDLDLILKHRANPKINTAKIKDRQDITITTDKTYAETFKDLETKYPDAIIAPGPIYQAENQTTKNITFHLDFYES